MTNAEMPLAGAEPLSTAIVNLPTDFQAFIHTSRYARWLDSERRREGYGETITRYLDFMRSHLLRNHGYTIPATLYRNLHDAIAGLEVMPSMRAMMTAGPALERCNVAAFNCFAGSETYVTREGLKSFADTVGTTQMVLAGDGEWRPAEIKSFGRQRLNRVVLRPGVNSRTKLRHEIHVTPDHRWITTNRGEVTDLRVGDLISYVGAPEEQSIEGFIRGFGFGDGTIDSDGRARVRLCGPKAKFLPVFEEFGKCRVYFCPSANGDPIVVFDKGVMTDWKQLPERPCYSWFDGYFQADGQHWAVQPGISSQDADAIQYVMDNGVYGGMAVTGLNWLTNETNFGKRSASLGRLTLRDAAEFRVVEIEEGVADEEVFCAVEPVTRSFVLKGGILTGNCTYVTVDSPRAFDEAMYLLMSGAGVGFSVERQYVNQMPIVNEHFERSQTVVHVGDSKAGWARALRELISLLYAGQIPGWDVSKVRPAGAPLKTFGGRASGPDPLIDLFKFCIRIFQNAAGRRLTSIECHDIMCKIGEVVVVGGVRRSAMLSLSNLSDERMRNAKSGEWWKTEPQRALANNSWCATEKPDIGIFMKEWLALYESKSGERGIFSRDAAKRQAGKNGRRDPDHDFGTNPCSEIILRPQQKCNLSEVVARENDSFEDLKRKIRLATILGTFQSTLTNFKYLRKIWKDNAEEERLLGVSITGIMDCKFLRKCSVEDLAALRDHAVEVNKEMAEALGINQSAAVTCVKPSGTVSQLTDSASGIHARHSPYYIRRVRGDIKDPLTQFMTKAGVPSEPCFMKPDSTVVFSFPVKAPEGAITRNDMSALEQLKFWLKFQRGWCEHKPSVTVSVREHEWMGVGAWVWEHFDEVSGISFLPHSEHNYKQAPYEEVSRKEYEALLEAMPPKIDWSDLSLFEAADHTAGAQTLACAAGGCEIVDIE